MSTQTTFKSVYRPVTKVVDETLFTSVLDFSGRATSLDFTEVQAVTFDALDNIQHFVDGQIVIISNRSPQNIYINSSLIIANKTIEIKPNSASIFIYLFSRSRFFDITNSGQIDDIQAAIEIINSNIDSIESLIANQYQELNQKITSEEAARLLEDQNLSSRISTLELDPVTKAYVDTQDLGILDDLSVEIADRLAGDQNLQNQIDAVISNTSVSINSLQMELDATQAGAGLLETNGSYFPNPNKAYINDAISLKNATEILDDELFSVSNDLTQEILDREQGDEETLAASKVYTDEQVSAEAIAREAADANLQNQINNVLSNIDLTALDSLTEIVAAFEAADDTLTGAITNLSTTLSQQISDLDAELDQEKLDRQSGDTALDTRITALEEQVGDDLQAAITSLETAIANEQSARIAADNAETLARETADQGLDTRITELESEVGDNLQAAITNLQTAITAEETARVAADLDITDRITALESEVGDNLQQAISNLQAADAAEALARQTADTALDARIVQLEEQVGEDLQAAINQIQTDIATETTARTAADTLLQTNITNVESGLAQEILDRQAGDQNLQTQLNSEITRAQSAELALQSNITTEELARIAGDQFLQNQITNILSNIDPVALDSLAEIVASLQDTEATINTTITNLTQQFNQDLNLEIQNRIAGDNLLQSNLNTETSEREAADTEINNLLDTYGAVLSKLTYKEERESFVVDEAMLAAGYFDLEYEAVDDSILLRVDRLYFHEDFDFYTEKINSITRIHFSGAIASGGSQALEINENIYVKYERLMDVFGFPIEDAIGRVIPAKGDYHKTLTNEDIQNGYIDLPTKIVENSLISHSGRLALIEDFDYNLELVNNKTRIVFAGPSAAGGSQALEAGSDPDTLHFKYEYYYN